MLTLANIASRRMHESKSPVLQDTVRSELALRQQTTIGSRRCSGQLLQLPIRRCKHPQDRQDGRKRDSVPERVVVLQEAAIRSDLTVHYLIIAASVCLGE